MFNIHKYILFNLLLFINISTLSLSSDYQYITLTNRQLCDLELLLNGGFAPLKTFLNSKDYNSVVEDMRLSDNSVWPMPIVLDVNETIVKKLESNPIIFLKSPEGHDLAKLEVNDIWKPNKENEALKVFKTTNIEHPGVNYLFNKTQKYYISGELTKIRLPKHYDFNELRRTPDELKELFQKSGYNKVVAFQTRNPMHRAHKELTDRAAKSMGAHLLIQPAVGETKPGDVDYVTRVRCYKKLLKHYENNVTLSLLPISMRMGGPREALWHALIRKNYGCTHFIIGRDHSGPGKDGNNNSFYEPYDAQNLVKQYEKEIGITVVPFKEMVYVQEDDNYQPIDEIDPSKKILTISGTQLRRLLNTGDNIPTWFTYPEIIEELRRAYPEKNKQGFTVFFTGLSGAGKSTLANALAAKLAELQHRSITILDGDIIRTYLSSELGFSKEHRSLNVKRVGFVANEITKNGGIAICALISPYNQDRADNREFISKKGGYLEVYVSTPLKVCENRDEKGLYEKAHAGEILNFTGISDPYEEPTNPEIIIDTSKVTVDNAIDQIVNFLKLEKILTN